ncbi:hypothetical protein ACFLU8_03975 [Chloroflexota bacterium]
MKLRKEVIDGEKIFLALLAVVLLLGGVAGGAYATVEHEPVKGEKLIGWGPMGKSQHSPLRIERSHTIFEFTNPDCKHDITIKQVSILQGGTVIYEGPFVSNLGDGRKVETEPIKPHKTWYIALFNYMYIGPEDPTVTDLENDANWLDARTARNKDTSWFTVEIAWEASKKECNPLIGFRFTRVYVTDPSDVEYTSWGYGLQMVNIKQGGK